MNGWLPGFLIGVAPLLLLVALLLVGRYPGESAIHRCRRAITLLLAPARASTPFRAPSILLCFPVRGGRLIASSLAGRAPPSQIEPEREFGCEVGGNEPSERKLMNINKRIILALVALFAVAMPTLASAHVTVSPEEVPAEGYAMLTFTVPHGCDGAATNRVSIKMPPEVISATPGVVGGWKIRSVEGKLPEPAEQHGETITEGVREVNWTGGPLPDGQLQQFPLSVALSGEEGETSEFKVVQGCEGGAETAWIRSVPASGEEPDHPAPAVELVAAEQGHGEDVGGESAETVAESPTDGEGSGDGLAIAALIVGGLGLAVGSVALVSGRRKVG